MAALSHSQITCNHERSQQENVFLADLTAARICRGECFFSCRGHAFCFICQESLIFQLQSVIVVIVIISEESLGQSGKHGGAIPLAYIGATVAQ